MFKQILELRRKRAGLIAEARAFMEEAEHESRQMNGDEQANFDRRMGEADAIASELETLEKRYHSVGRLSEAEQQLERRDGPRGGQPERWQRENRDTKRVPRFIGQDSEGHIIRGLGPEDSFADAMRDSGELRTDSRMDGVTFGSLMRALVLGPRNAEEKRALGEATDGAGGVTVMPELLAQIIDKMRAVSTVSRAGATTVPLRTQKTSIARLAADATVTWHGENAADFSASDPTFERVQFIAQTLIAEVKVSRELFEDSVNLDEALQTSLAGALGGELDRVALIGSGSAPEPKGIKNISGVALVDLTPNGAALADYNNFISIFQLLKDGNAPDPTAFIMSPRTQAAAGKLQDTTHQPMRLPPLIENVPFYATTRLPVNETQGTSNIASRVITGYFPHLLIGIRSELRVELMKEIFSGNFQYGLLAFLRADIQLAHPESFGMIRGIIP